MDVRKAGGALFFVFWFVNDIYILFLYPRGSFFLFRTKHMGNTTTFISRKVT